MTCPELHSWGDAKLKLAPCLFESQTHFQTFYSTCFLGSWEPIAQQKLSRNPVSGSAMSRRSGKAEAYRYADGARRGWSATEGSLGAEGLWEC